MRYSCQGAMRTMVTVIGPEGMVAVIKTMVGGGTADAETGSQPVAIR